MIWTCKSYLLCCIPMENHGYRLYLKISTLLQLGIAWIGSGRWFAMFRSNIRILVLGNELIDTYRRIANVSFHLLRITLKVNMQNFNLFASQLFIGMQFILKLVRSFYETKRSFFYRKQMKFTFRVKIHQICQLCWVWNW